MQGIALLRSYWIARIISDLFIASTSFGQTIIWAMPLLIISVAVECMLNYTISNISVRCGAQIKNHLREDLLDKILSLGPAYVTQKRSGDLSNVLVSKIEALEGYYTTYMPCALSALFVGVAVIIFLFQIDGVVALVCMTGLAVVFLVPNLWYRIMQQRGQSDWQLMAEFESDMLDNLQGMTTLKAFGASGTRAKRLEKLAWAMHRNTVKNLSVSEIESIILLLGHGCGSVLSVGLAIVRATAGHFPTNQLILALFLISACFSPVFSLIDAWHMGYHGLTASPAIFQLLTTRDECHTVAWEGNDGSRHGGEVKYEHVTFRYEENQRPVLQDFSMIIPRGTTVALVGRSGSGKSTIIHLLAGFYAPQNGNISLDGHSIGWYSQSALRARLGVVWQEPYLFYGTVEENIRMGNPEATVEMIKRAAQMAQAHAFIERLPKGYQTLVGERGMRLSGGERQRIAIARCFLRDAECIIFDEATSSLDGENEAAIQKAMETLLKDKTALIVAHRLSTVEHADCIYVLEEGKIIQSGTHQELLLQGGAYRDLMNAQSGGISNA